MKISVTAQLVSALKNLAHAINVIVRPASAYEKRCFGFVFVENIENFNHVFGAFVHVESKPYASAIFIAAVKKVFTLVKYGFGVPAEKTDE